MKLSTFCKICKRTLAWGYYQIKRGNIQVDLSNPYRITGISLSLYSELKQKGVFNDIDNPKEMEYINSIIF